MSDHERDFVTGLWKRSDQFWKKQREELFKNLSLDFIVATEDKVLDGRNGENLWITSSLDDAMRYIKRSIELLPWGFTSHICTAHDLVMDYLSTDGALRFRSLYYTNLYLLAGYTDIPNRQLENIFTHVVETRRIKGKRTWVFTPGLENIMNGIWGSSISKILRDHFIEVKIGDVNRIPTYSCKAWKPEERKEYKQKKVIRRSESLSEGYDGSVTKAQDYQRMKREGK